MLQQLVRRPLPDAARHRVPRSEIVLPPLFQTERRRGDRDRDLDLAPHQPRQPAREHPADAAARRPDPEEGREPHGRGRGAQEAVAYGRQRRRLAAAASSASASRSRSSGFTRKPSMPAARQASRSSRERIGGERDDRRARSSRFGLGGADAARRFDAVEPRHVHVHQHEIVGRAGSRASCQACSAAAPLPARPARWPSRASSARVEQRVDLVVLGDQDASALGAGGFGVRRTRRRRVAASHRDQVRRRARRERGGADRLHQITGEAGLLSAGSRAARPA